MGGSDASRKAKYGEALNLIKTSIEGRAEFQNAQQYISECFYQGCEMLQMNQIASVLITVLQSGEKGKVSDLISNIKR